VVVVMVMVVMVVVMAVMVVVVMVVVQAWTDLAQNIDRWRALVNVVMNLRVS